MQALLVGRACTILTTLVSRMVFEQPWDEAALLGLALMAMGTLILKGFSSLGTLPLAGGRLCLGPHPWPPSRGSAVCRAA